MAKKEIDGSSVLYDYLQKNLREDDIWLFQTMTARLVLGLGIWLHPDIYRRYPFLLPHVVRDPDSRGDPKKGIPDQWASPNKRGELRDDNSLVKNVPKSLTIEGPPGSVYAGGRARKGFVAAHVWAKTQPDGQPAPWNRLTNSFAPNLVWLPTEISKLTDREGSFVQQFIQAVSLEIYRNVDVVQPMVSHINAAWDLLRKPTGIPKEALPEPGTLNFFHPNDRWFRYRRRLLSEVVGALSRSEAGKTPIKRNLPPRYVKGLPSVSPGALKKLRKDLESYREACDAAEADQETIG